MSNKNTIQYRQVGDYLIPNLTLPSESKQHIGKWGQLHRDYLRQHKKVQFNIMLTQGTLWSYLADIDRQAHEMFDTLVEQMKEKEDVTERLKAENQMEWVQRVNNIQARAKEIVNSELIYT
mgnify:CR=1 FL=1